MSETNSNQILKRVEDALQVVYYASLLKDGAQADAVVDEVKSIINRLSELLLDFPPAPPEDTSQEGEEAARGFREFCRREVESVTGLHMVGVSRRKLERISARAWAENWSPEQTQEAFSELYKTATGELTDATDRPAS
jgi:hypothetical protein